MAQQLRRTAELDALRAQRRLSQAEASEADDLAHRAYMRVWHRELRLSGAGR